MGGYIAIGGSLITIVLNLILVPIIGIYGPAWAALVCFGFMAGAAYWTGQKNYKIDYPIRKMLLYIAVALAGYFLNDWGRSIWEDATGIILLVNTLILGACVALFYAIDPLFFNSILQGVKGMLPARFQGKSE